MSQQTFDQNLFGKTKTHYGRYGSEKPRGLEGFLVTVDEVTSHVVVVCRQPRHWDLRGSPAHPSIEMGSYLYLIYPLETISGVLSLK